MNVSAHRAFSFLRTYGYERVSCSKEERTVAEALLNECTSLGVSAQLEEFTVPCGRVSHALLRVTSPYVKEYEARATSALPPPLKAVWTRSSCMSRMPTKCCWNRRRAKLCL